MGGVVRGRRLGSLVRSSGRIMRANTSVDRGDARGNQVPCNLRIIQRRSNSNGDTPNSYTCNKMREERGRRKGEEGDKLDNNKL